MRARTYVRARERACRRPDRIDPAAEVRGPIRGSRRTRPTSSLPAQAPRATAYCLHIDDVYTVYIVLVPSALSDDATCVRGVPPLLGCGVGVCCEILSSMLCMIPGLLAAMTLSAGPTPMQMSYAKAFM